MSVFRFFLFGLFFSFVSTGFGQQPLGNAGLPQRMAFLQEYHKKLDYQQAALELEDLVFYLRREKVGLRAGDVRLVSEICIALNQRTQLMRFLEEFVPKINQDTPIKEVVDINLEAVEAYRTLDKQDIANELENGIFKAYNTLYEVQSGALAKYSASDSLSLLPAKTPQLSSDDLTLSKDWALGIGAAVFTLLLFCIWRIFRVKHNLGKKLEQAQFEREVALGKLHSNHLEAPVDLETKTTTASTFSVSTYDDEVEKDKIALIIQPDSHSSMYMRMILNKRFEVETAQTPAEAKELTNTIFPDLIVCDAQLNGVTGIDFIRDLKMTEKTAHIPVVLLTDNDYSGKQDAARAGAEQWLQRPTLGGELLGRVDALLVEQNQKHKEFERTLQLWYSEQRVEFSDAFLAKVVKFYESNLGDPNFTPEEVAKKFQLSNMLFHRKVVAMTGKTPTQLLREMRMEKSRFLLNSGSLPLELCAQMVGYDHAGTFTLAFKNHFGDSPMLLRQ